ncbi:expressed protein [Echinococcus multilocularis]|uniref:Expressed protein n=1 Tax=Echinococcus multilocularis TaxID=6211 RepID=A0A087VWZ5_ECHMU|nr:expressed protein [Echinococcus multilocularis]
MDGRFLSGVNFRLDAESPHLRHAASDTRYVPTCRIIRGHGGGWLQQACRCTW